MVPTSRFLIYALVDPAFGAVAVHREDSARRPAGGETTWMVRRAV